MAGIYIHIPFCKKACHYCDFHFSVNHSQLEEMINAILLEMELQQNYLEGDEISTIYFGGGTPSLLPSSHLELFINSIHKNFRTSPKAEITLEANPDDLDKKKLNELRSSGINRLSIGIQSFDDKQLHFLNRAHNAEEAQRCLETARQQGFNNISIDLIHSIPGQNTEALNNDLQAALTFSPEHISAYSLTIEDKTVFGKWAKSKKIQPMEEDQSAILFETLMDKLENEGYQQYEISNFSKPGMISKHNSSYWLGEKYLGVGPSAHSFNQDSRQSNIRNNSLYIDSVKRHQIPFELEPLTRENRINEFIYTSLRTQWGCNNLTLKRDFNYDLLSQQQDYVGQLVSNGHAQLNNQVLTLQRSGKLIADKIAMDLFLPV